MRFRSKKLVSFTMKVFVLQNIEWKTKNNELEQETEKLHRIIAATAENLKAKISYSLELSKYVL